VSGRHDDLVERRFQAATIVYMKTKLATFALCLFFANSSFAADSNKSLLRLKSGINYPQENGEVTHYTPIAIEGVYRLSQAFGVGVHSMYSSGNHAVYAVQGPNLAGFNLSKKMILAMASGNYFTQFGNARIQLGVKAGPLFYSDKVTLSSGLSVPDVTSSKTVIAFGPSVDLDLPLKDIWFVNLGGDYMISQNHYHFGSLYVGIGVDF
jgi:hypothetical protein